MLICYLRGHWRKYSKFIVQKEWSSCASNKLHHEKEKTCQRSWGGNHAWQKGRIIKRWIPLISPANSTTISETGVRKKLEEKKLNFSSVNNNLHQTCAFCVTFKLNSMFHYQVHKLSLICIFRSLTKCFFYL